MTHSNLPATKTERTAIEFAYGRLERIAERCGMSGPHTLAQALAAETRGRDRVPLLRAKYMLVKWFTRPEAQIADLYGLRPAAVNIAILRAYAERKDLFSADEMAAMVDGAEKGEAAWDRLFSRITAA
jgi:hypothetical protein